MSDSKMLKARCTKTGRAYGLELKKFGADWKVVNMIDLSSDEAGIIMSEVRQPFFETNIRGIQMRHGISNNESQ